MEGLIAEGSRVLEADGPDPVVDALAHRRSPARRALQDLRIRLCASSPRTHKEHNDAANLLQQTLDEESAADEKLTSISEGDVLVAAGSEEQATAD